MSQLQEYTSLWWPEERIKATLDAKYIISRLRPENIPRLFELPDWGEGLTSETYMEWILLKAGRVFLILDAIGIPDRIFALVDESCDDDDLPVAEHSIDLLHLSPDGEDIALDTRFFHAQWRFIVRGIAEGEHVVYTENEGVPVEAVRTNTSSGIHGRDDTVDKVVLAGSVCRVFMRTQVQVNGAPHFFTADEVLDEIRKLRKLSHEHLVSVYGSYLKEDTVCVLFTGAAADRNLHSFLTDEPLSFKRLAKEQRRRILITWPHCLASAVAWLHARGHSHGAIRPSNIFIDADYHICLGQFQALDSLLTPPHVNDLEAYNYSAPERWTRTAAPIIQKPQPQVQTIQPSGGRTKRRQKPANLALAPLNESPLSSPDHKRPDSAASKGTVIRIGLPGSPSRFSMTLSSSSSSAASTTSPKDTTVTKRRIPAFWSRRKPPSITSSNSSSATSTANSTSTPSMPSSPSSLHPPQTASHPQPQPRPLSPFTLPLRHSRSAQSLAPSFNCPRPPSISPSQPLPPNSTPAPGAPQSPADLFSLASITLDILTFLHKRTLAAFAAHRAARNRSAGRGGGMADASFHLARNAVQVQSWIALLEGDALKKCRRGRRSDRCFWAVPKMLIVLRAMLDVEVGRRPSARRVRRLFGEAIESVEGEGIHCVRKGKEEEKKDKGGEGDGSTGDGGKIEEFGKGRVVKEVVEERMGSSASVAKSVVPSESASEFNFGFGDTDETETETETETENENESEIEIEGEGMSFLEAEIHDIVEQDESGYDSEPDMRIQQHSPQLYLPQLDANIAGMEGLTFNDFR